MIYFQVQNNRGKILAGNMQDFSQVNEFENNRNFSKYSNGKGLKSVSQTIGDINIWVLVEDEVDLLKSSKIFNKTFQMYKTVAIDIYNQYKKEITSYAHILNTIQGQIRQKIDDFADARDFFGETYGDSVQRVLEIIESNKEASADLICYVQKRAVDMRAHLLGTEVVNSGEQYEVKPVIVSLKRAILNQCTPFLEEFEKNMVEIKFFFDNDCKIEVDKNMFSLVMYNFFSNAEKYTKTNSQIRLNYSEEKRSLDISMISLKMDKSELANLHMDGRRGIHAKTVPGNGIGLFVIGKALEIMGKPPMLISPNYEKCFREDDLMYVENHFQFTL